MRVIDLFSGLGGFSQAFVDRGHDVLRLDFDDRFLKVPHTTICDIMELQPDDLWTIHTGYPDIILASPPCQHFSIAAVSHHWKHGKPTEATKQQIELVKHTIRLIEDISPKFWILENPRGMLRKVIGRPDKTVFMAAYGKEAYKPTDLWGVFPPIEWLMPMKWEKAPRGSSLGVQGYGDPAKAALIPYRFSMAVCLAAEGNSPQRTIGDFEE